MAYTINKFNGSLLTSVEDGTIDRNTSLKLVGRNFAGYGEIQNENFVFLLENFSNNTPPSRPLKGQLWFDSNNQKLKIYNNDEFRSLGLIEISQDQPENLSDGEFWWDSSNDQLYGYNGDSFELVGPEKAGSGVTRLVSTTVKDNTDTEIPIIRAQVEDETVFVISDREFNLSSESFIDGFSVIKQGITLKNSSTGVTEPSEYWLWGSASNADKLDNLDSAQFLRSDEDTTLSGNLLFADNNTGLEFGTSSVKENSNTLDLSVQEADFTFTESISGTTSLKIDSLYSDNGLTYFGNTVWHQANQGSGSGLDSDTLDGLEAEDFLGANEKAVDSDKLDGIDSSGFLRIDGKAVDSDKLDGLEGTYYLNFDNFTSVPDPTITLSGDATGSVTLTDLQNGTLAVTVVDNSHNHIIANVDGLQSALDGKLNLTGGKLTGNIQFSDNEEGIEWSRNSDGASIKFYSTSDNSTDTRLEFQTRDNENEYFLWSHSPTGNNSDIELMRLVPNDSTNGLTFRQNKVWHEGNQGSGSGLDADTVDGKNSSDFLPIDGKADSAVIADKADNSIRLNGLTADTFFRKTGGTVTDFVTLHADPINDFHAATKKYVEDYVDTLLSRRLDDFDKLKAYVRFDGDHLNIRNSFNVQNVQLLDRGLYRITFQENFADDNYIVHGIASDTDHFVTFRRSNISYVEVYTVDNGSGNNHPSTTRGDVMITIFE